MKDCLTLPMGHTKMHFSAKCNSGHVAIQWFHIKHYFDYRYTKFQPYTFRVQKVCVYARYATLVPRLHGIARKSGPTIVRHREVKISKATSSLFPIKMIAILERTQSNVQQNIEQLQTPTMGVTKPVTLSFPTSYEYLISFSRINYLVEMNQ